MSAGRIGTASRLVGNAGQAFLGVDQSLVDFLENMGLLGDSLSHFCDDVLSLDVFLDQFLDLVESLLVSVILDFLDLGHSER